MSRIRQAPPIRQPPRASAAILLRGLCPRRDQLWRREASSPTGQGQMLYHHFSFALDGLRAAWGSERSLRTTCSA